MDFHQKSQLYKSLKIFTNILKSCGSEYRVIGSSLLAVYFKNYFRKIHDIDILIDSISYENVLKGLQKNGFILNKYSWCGFSWMEATKKNYIPIEFFLVGEFRNGYFKYRATNFLELKIENDYIKPVIYKFQKIKLIGVSLSTCLAGIRESSFNPKRILDEKLLLNELKNKKINRYNNICIYFFGIKIPYLYDFLCFLHNAYGGIRVIMGRNWESWD